MLLKLVESIVGKPRNFLELFAINYLVMRALYLPSLDPGALQIASAIDMAAFQYIADEPADVVAERLITNVQASTDDQALGPVVHPILQLEGNNEITHSIIYEHIVSSSQKFLEITSSDREGLSLWMQDVHDAFHPNRKTIEAAIEDAPEPLGMMFCQGDGSAHLTFLNRINRELSGFSKAQVPGTNVSRFFDKPDRPKVKAFIRRCLHDKRATERGIPMRRRNGELIKVDMNAWLRTGSREATFQVINETVREQALGFNRIFEEVSRRSTGAKAIFRFDAEGKPDIIQTSAALSERLGYEPGELDEMPFRKLLPRYLHSALDTRVRRLDETGVFDWPEVPLLTKDGQEILFDIKANASEVEGARYAEVTFGDTEARQAAERDASAAAKADTIINLGGQIAHDFNNIFTGLLGGLDMVEGEKNPVKRAGLIKTLRNVTQTMVAMNQSLRHLTDSTPPGVGIDLNLILKTILSEIFIRMMVKSQVDIKVEPYRGKDPRYIAGPVYEIWRIAINFVKNAIEAMENSEPRSLIIRASTAHIRDEAELRRLDPKYKFEKAKPGDFGTLTIEDTGPGISDEILMRIFENGFSTKSDSDVNRGRGLASSYGAVARRGGLITVKTAVGRGTCFTLYFPRVGDHEETKEAKPTARSEYVSEELRSPGGEAILVADDDVGIRNQFERLLRHYNYETTLIVKTTDEVLEVVRSRQEKQLMLSAIILDWRMPSMTGSELVAHLARIDPNLPILVYTGLIPDDSVHHPRLKFIKKPQGGMALAQALRDIIDDDGSSKNDPEPA